MIKFIAILLAFTGTLAAQVTSIPGGTGGGGGGGVSSVSATGGIEVVGGAPITSTGTIRAAVCLNPQTGTTYSIVTGDRGCVITANNASASSYTLPQAGTTGFDAKWAVLIRNINNGVVTITPTASNIAGQSSVDLRNGEYIELVSDGTNYVVAGTNRTRVDSALSVVNLAAGGIQIGAGASLVTLTDPQTLTGKTLDSPILLTPDLGIPSSGTLSNVSGLPIDGGTVGTLPAGRGGTGLTAFSRSGNTTEFGTVSGTKTTGKQLAFDASGNVIASASDIGGGGGGSFDPSTTSTCVDEMNYAAVATTTGLGQCNLQFANATTSAVADTDESGIVTLTTTASSSGIGSASSLNTSVLFGGAQYSLWSRVKLDTLSDATDTYTVTAGYADSGSVVDGCYIRYSHSINSGKWQGVCTANSVSTTLDLGITVAISTWYKLLVVVNATGTSAEFFVNGTSGGTITTNIPTGAGRQTGIMTRIVKSAGTTARLLNVGFIAQGVTYATAR